jgi:cytochrome b involved in lipid metabolism
LQEAAAASAARIPEKSPVNFPSFTEQLDRLAAHTAAMGLCSSSNANREAPFAETGVTLADVQAHNAQDAESLEEQGLWVVLRGHVFDLTKFVHDHPGGTSVLMAGE